MPKSDLLVRFFASERELDDFLAAEPITSKGFWLKLAKKNSPIKGVSREEAIECGLCHGWIDGQLDKFDEHHWLIRFTPRRATSKWSEKNRDKAIELTAQGRMQPAGLAEVEKAKADGRWDAAYARQSTATVPDDLQRALDANPEALTFFNQLDGHNRFAILYRVHGAKQAKTRAAHIEKYIAMLAKGETIYPLKRKR
ncbi:Uncharacterized conserved protein YdeI, YjbR/CyaY-like superfamily, DUF1801 family [Phyllobacterium sp. CL33Tsu]|uniref:YdeI/OmpD-associated family protein n=1 Tax=Phyllobacterium sp. CL33Tsu TaxID=1798191 RepID=UPI0008E87D11|nr:YdeI/OmpD-associated family protein [Phyllobacterium sp. CL33Tsu]SFJ36434.1 Uncharacterized conserved protein YdeI, YjbR/CyaY-like superfamily, DUF1801 family [Phyllobacterium sp. CL33Tsu]